MDKYERQIGFIVGGIGHQESEAHDQFTIKSHECVVKVLKTFRYVNAAPKVLL